MALGSVRRLIGAVAVVACTTAGCADDIRGQLVVVVASDMRVPSELDEVGVRVIGPLESRALDREYPLDGSGAVSLPISFGVAPAGGDPDRIVTIEVDARRGGTVLFTVRHRTRFVDGEVRQLVIFLSGACVGAAPCPDDTTCEVGQCLPELVDVRTLPRYSPNGPLPDAGPPREGGTMDVADMSPRDLGGDERRDEDEGVDDMGPEDAGEVDTGPMDLGAPDTGAPDTGPRDGGPMDAGDAGRDMGRPDLGVDAGDAGRTDAGPDAGPMDGGPDAGPTDAGPDDGGDAAMTDDGGDDAGMCSESPCRPVAPQCGCPGTLGCTLRTGGSTECRALGTRDEGESCADDSLACRPGLGCISSGGGPAVCRVLCEASAGCDAVEACIGITGFPSYGSCQAACDLADAMACTDPLGCVIGQTIEDGRSPICATVGTDPIGTPCSGNTCAPGLACVTPPGLPTQCRPWCRRPGPCAPGAGTCGAVSPAPIFGGVEYGICVP